MASNTHAAVIGSGVAGVLKGISVDLGHAAKLHPTAKSVNYTIQYMAAVGSISGFVPEPDGMSLTATFGLGLVQSLAASYGAGMINAALGLSVTAGAPVIIS